MTDESNDARRHFLKLGLGALACSVTASLTAPVMAAMPRLSGIKALAFHNLHTDERLRVVYWKNGVYSRPALARVNHILRDFRVNETYPMHVGLMDLLYDLQHRLGNDNAVEVISGYRSPRTNAMLASYSDGVAKRSYHLKGMAIDIRLPGTSLQHLHNTALAMDRGGVGYYPSSDFVHMDVGPVRRW